MEILEHIISSLDYILDSKRKRHITGGILISASMLFSGFAITVMTIKSDEETDPKPKILEKEDDIYENE